MLASVVVVSCRVRACCLAARLLGVETQGFIALGVVVALIAPFVGRIVRGAAEPYPRLLSRWLPSFARAWAMQNEVPEQSLWRLAALVLGTFVTLGWATMLGLSKLGWSGVPGDSAYGDAAVFSSALLATFALRWGIHK